MPFQPTLAPRTRRRQVAPGLQHTTPLEATGMLLAVTGPVIRGSALPTASVTTHPGCAMRMSVAPVLRKCQSQARKEEPSKGRDWLEKVQMANKHQAKTASKIPITPKQNKMALPDIIGEDNKDFEKPGQKLPKRPVCFSHAKASPLGNKDMTPWTGPSQSETSFHVLFKPMVSFLHSVPFSAAGTPGFYSFFPELDEKTPMANGEQKRKATLCQAKTKQKAHHRGSPRHFRSKWQGMKLPPVPAITNLNFSRNFTFSFFDLPPHQNHEYWVQRQQLTRFLMKQLQ